MRQDMICTETKKVPLKLKKVSDLLSRFRYPILFMASCLAIGYVIFHRFIILPVPQGIDTPYYFFTTGFMLKTGSVSIVVGSSRELTYLVIFVIRFTSEYLLGFSFRESSMVLPIVFGLAYSISLYYLAKKLYGNQYIAILAAFIAGMSGFFLRLSLDLYSQLLGFTLMQLFLAMYADFTSGEKKTNYMFLVVLNTLIFLAHSYTWFFNVIVVVLNNLLFVLIFRTKPKNIVKSSLLWLPALVYLMLVFTSSRMGFPVIPNVWYERKAAPTVIDGLLYAQRAGDINPMSLPISWESVLRWETPILLLLTIVGLYKVTMVDPINRRHLPLLSWFVAIPLLFLTTGYPEWYRLLPTPVGILSAQGLCTLHHVVSKKTDTFRFRLKIASRSTISLAPIGGLLSLAIIMMIFISALASPFTNGIKSYPNEVGISQLIDVEKRFGYANDKVVILVEEYAPEHRFAWGRALTGMDVYVGRLKLFLEKVPFSAAGVSGIIIDPSSKEILVIPSALYDAKEDYKNATEISLGLFMIKLRLDSG